MDYKKLEINEKIEFIQKTEMYGIAYFQFCFKINKAKKIEEIFITPSQQPDKTHGWVIESGVSNGFVIEEHILNYNPIWHSIRSLYCEEHKSMCITVSAPPNTSILYCDHIGSDIWFKFR